MHNCVDAITTRCQAGWGLTLNREALNLHRPYDRDAKAAAKAAAGAKKGSSKAE